MRWIGRIFMLSLGACLGGAFFIIRDGLPYWKAQQTGVVMTQRNRPTRVLRSEEPERFAGLMAGRRKWVVTGVMMMFGGAFGMLAMSALFMLAFNAMS